MTFPKFSNESSSTHDPAHTIGKKIATGAFIILSSGVLVFAQSTGGMGSGRSGQSQDSTNQANTGQTKSNEQTGQTNQTPQTGRKGKNSQTEQTQQGEMSAGHKNTKKNRQKKPGTNPNNPGATDTETQGHHGKSGPDAGTSNPTTPPNNTKTY